MKLILSLPATPYGLNQGFGVNGAYYQANGINIKGHNGLDLRTYHGQPVYASHDGVAYYQSDDKQGHGVVIITDQPYDYKGGISFYKTIYWHFAEPSDTYPQLITNGQKVTRGQQIGWADNSGLSSGDHLHFGLKPITNGTPPTYGDAPDVGIGGWVNQEPDNGYLGAIDPFPYFGGANIVSGFYKDLFFGSRGDDVRRLQMWLNAHAYVVTPLGEETSFFGLKTRAAVARFQVDNGLYPSLGYFGPKTRATVNNS